MALAVVASSRPAWREALAYSRARIGEGQLWRFATCHLVHGWPAVLVLDLGAVLLIGAAIERCSRASFIAVASASALASSAALWFVRPDLARYEGSSAIACGCFAYACVTACTASSSSRVRTASIVLLLAFAAKTWAECAGIVAWRPAGLPREIEVVGLAHAAGGIAGAAAAIARRARLLPDPRFTAP